MPIGIARPGAAARLLMARLPFFYGWIILACACGAGFARQGPAVATLSIFVEPMTSSFGWCALPCRVRHRSAAAWPPWSRR